MGSTYTNDQYAGDAIAARGAGYGFYTMRVDGNDLLAVHECTAKAREIAVEQNQPVLIEAMTYRGGHHSTSDDSTRYRDPNEIRYWANIDNLINRMNRHLVMRGLWTDEQDTQLKNETRTKV